MVTLVVMLEYLKLLHAAVTPNDTVIADERSLSFSDRSSAISLTSEASRSVIARQRCFTAPRSRRLARDARRRLARSRRTEFHIEHHSSILVKEIRDPDSPEFSIH